MSKTNIAHSNKKEKLPNFPKPQSTHEAATVQGNRADKLAPCAESAVPIFPHCRHCTILCTNICISKRSIFHFFSRAPSLAKRRPPFSHSNHSIRHGYGPTLPLLFSRVQITCGPPCRRGQALFLDYVVANPTRSHPNCRGQSLISTMLQRPIPQATSSPPRCRGQSLSRTPHHAEHPTCRAPFCRGQSLRF